jgi:hypothetical protein
VFTWLNAMDNPIYLGRECDQEQSYGVYRLEKNSLGGRCENKPYC